MAAGEEVDAELARGRQGGLLRLARHERVVALVRGLDQACPAASRDHRHALDALRALGEHDRRAAGRRLEPTAQFVDRNGLAVARADADLRERAVTLRAEPL